MVVIELAVELVGYIHMVLLPNWKAREDSRHLRSAGEDCLLLVLAEKEAILAGKHAEGVLSLHCSLNVWSYNEAAD